MVHMLQRRGNSHGIFLELSEYGNGDRWTFLILLKGREGIRWTNCLAQLRKLEKFFEKKDVGGKTGGKLQIAPTMVMKPTNHGGWTFAVVLVGQGHDLEKGELSRGNWGTSGKQTLSILVRAEKETGLAEGDWLVNVGAEIMPNGFVEGKL
jgi:hypothetical protein